MRADGPASIVKKLPALKVLNKKEIQLKVGGRRRVLYIATAIRSACACPSLSTVRVASIRSARDHWLDPSGISRLARSQRGIPRRAPRTEGR